MIFDGFDELALRLTFEGAAEHLRMVLSAVSGRAKSSSPAGHGAACG
jgi:hypothetical protein